VFQRYIAGHWFLLVTYVPVMICSINRVHDQKCKTVLFHLLYCKVCWESCSAAIDKTSSVSEPGLNGSVMCLGLGSHEGCGAIKWIDTVFEMAMPCLC